MRSCLVIFCFTLFLPVSPLLGQNYNIIRYGVREGVLHSLVTGIVQDPRGDIWMSTGGGLCRFNGVDFQYYTTRDGLAFTRLTCIASDDDGNIWVGSSKGLNFLNGKAIQTVGGSLQSNEIIFLASAGNSMVWAIASNGLYRISFLSGKFTVESVDFPGFQPTEQAQIFQDRTHRNFVYQAPNGRVFFGNNGKLYGIENMVAVQIHHPDYLLVNSAYEANGNLLFATNRGLYNLRDSLLVPYLMNNLSSIDIKTVRGYRNRLWILGNEYGNRNYIYEIDINDTAYLRKIGKENGLSDDPTQIMVDHEGNLWATSNNGANLLRSKAFVAFTTSEGLIGNKTWGIARTADGSIWVGTIGEGLTVIKDNKFYNFNTNNGLPDNYVGKIFEDSQGAIYIGTSNAGLNRAYYNKNSKSYYFRRLALLPDIKVRIDDIIEDGEGTIWVATSKGLYFSKNRNSFNKFNLTATDTGQFFIQKLQIDGMRKIMWVGTRNNGAFFIQNNTPIPFKALSANEEVSSIALDSQGNVWFGTRNNGLYRFDGTHTMRISENDGLASNLIYILHPDGYNNLWVGTNLGLDRIDLASLTESKRIAIRHYGSDEGLIDIETNLNGVLNDGNGNFWIATNGGLLRYDRNSDMINSTPPKVRLTSLKLNSQDTNWEMYSNVTDFWSGLPNNLTLNHNQNHLTFEFVGVSFRNPKLVKYVWKLEGFDDKWIENSNRQAIYSNIPPGRYQFRLKAANSDGIWSAEVHSMPITIKPPVWATLWFRLTMVITVGLLVYLYVLYRIKRLRHKQRELENLVSIRTLELREQFEIVDEKNKQILDSLNYAKFLQNAILPPVEQLKLNFSDSFVIHRPKDYVSGDFYWYQRQSNVSVLAVADCTGHGVPGAIISVICENALRQAVTECKFENPAKILLQTNQHVLNAFNQSQKEIHHGMEIALCTFDHTTNELVFSGANLGIHILQDNNLIKLKPCIQRIGWSYRTIPFTNHTLKLLPGSRLFLFTDGFVDQFEPKNKKKFSSARLRKLLLNSCNQPMSRVQTLLESEFEAWKGSYDQIDDVLVIGLAI